MRLKSKHVFIWIASALPLFAVSVNLKPDSVTLRAGETRTFTFTGTSLPTGYKTRWSVNGVAGGNATLGTITSAGLYTTPAVPYGADGKVTLKLEILNSAGTSVVASDSSAITVQNPVVSVTGVTPVQFPTGAFTLTINGAGFIPATTVTSPNLTLTATRLSATQMRVTGTVTDAQLGYTLAFRVTNPAPGSTTAYAYAKVRNATAPLHTAYDAYSFLRRATWGPKAADVDRLQRIGKSAWLNEQFALPVSPIPAALESKSLEWTQDYWYSLAVNAPDQLRLRTAWALHKIWVVSGLEVDCAEVYIPYLRILMNRAFGNYYDLMRDVTLSAAMGEYLDMLNNAKANLSKGTVPNENYARELMQLFTIGLVELNPDGTPKSAPTYTQDDVMSFSRALTGWTYNDGTSATLTDFRYSFKPGPMKPVQRHHDTAQKTLLRGTVLAANRTAAEDLESALRNLFDHPNLPPFVSRQLIQQLVKSDPSPAYVGRAAAVFVNNGTGVRGDLRAVVRAILTDPEVTATSSAAGPNGRNVPDAPTELPLSPSGNKLTEPALFVSHIVRAMQASVTDTPFMANLAAEMGQNVLYPPSVFSYFSPGFRIAGGTLNAPEFQIYTSATSLVRANFVVKFLTGGFGGDVRVDLAPWTALAKNPAALTGQVNDIFFGGKMSAEMRTVIEQAVISQSSDKEKAQTALYLALSSPQFSVER